MGNIGAPEIILLLLVALLLFGAKRLPEIGRSLGSGMREFKDSVTGTQSEPTQTTTQATQLPPPPPPAPGTTTPTPTRENETVS
jgi:sec-independent protein translocase protein TatA